MVLAPLSTDHGVRGRPPRLYAPLTSSRTVTRCAWSAASRIQSPSSRWNGRERSSAPVFWKKPWIRSHATGDRRGTLRLVQDHQDPREEHLSQARRRRHAPGRGVACPRAETSLTIESGTRSAQSPLQPDRSALPPADHRLNSTTAVGTSPSLCAAVQCGR